VTSAQSRIVITGLGAISALGHNAAANWAAARDGAGGIEIVQLDPGPHGPPPPYQTVPLARVSQGYEAAYEARFGRKISGFLDPFALMPLCAAAEALDQAGLIDSPALDTRTAVVLGHGMGGLATLEKGYERLFGMKTPRVHPTMVPRVMVSAGVSAVAMAFGVHGPVFAASSACASSAHAMVQGAGLIAQGLADVAIVGGSEAIATPGCMRGWEGIQALSATACRPFSAGRDGMVMGEGAAILVLESRAHALARGATILGEYLGAGMSSDAFHITQPSLDGVSAAIRQAVTAGDLLAEDEVLISTHGTGTPLNDQNETAALRVVFGSSLDRHPVVATKSAHGHLIGGTAALQGVIALQALNAGLAPPILGFQAADPNCDLNLVLEAARPIRADKALLNAFAFGGLNVAIALGSRASALA
jgi:nodulation protein E